MTVLRKIHDSQKSKRRQIRLCCHVHRLWSFSYVKFDRISWNQHLSKTLNFKSLMNLNSIIHSTSYIPISNSAEFLWTTKMHFLADSKYRIFEKISKFSSFVPPRSKYIRKHLQNFKDEYERMFSNQETHFSMKVRYGRKVIHVNFSAEIVVYLHVV